MLTVFDKQVECLPKVLLLIAVVVVITGCLRGWKNTLIGSMPFKCFSGSMWDLKSCSPIFDNSIDLLHFTQKAALLSLHFNQFLNSGLESQSFRKYVCFLLILLVSPIKNKDLLNTVTHTITSKTKLMIPKKLQNMKAAFRVRVTLISSSKINENS